MKKSDLVAEVAERTETKKQAQEIVDLIFDSIKSALKKKDPVAIAGFGILKIKQTKARTGRNPKTGETIQIPAKKKVSFRPAKELKELVK